MERTWPEYDLRISEVKRGLLVEQCGDAYVARNWRLSPSVVEVIETALKYGLASLIQNGHPQASKREPAGDGAVYLSFARRPNEYWILVLNDNSTDDRQDYRQVKKVLFKKQFRHALEQAGVPWEVEKFRNASNIEVPAQHLVAGIEACLPYADDHVVRGGKRGAQGNYSGFQDEADIERWLMENLTDTNAGRNLRILGRQVRIDAGIIDILLQDKFTGGLVVLEVKQGRAQPVHVEQLERYLSSPQVQARAAGKPVSAWLVAEVVEHTVVDAIEKSRWPIAAFEIKWLGPDNIRLSRVAGQ